VLRDPILVEAAEDLFHPLLIRNNVAGKDAILLKHFKEPAWNYQVIRYLNSEAEDLIPRRDKIWTTGGTAVRMVEALRAANCAVPTALQNHAWARTAKLREAVFAMHCFWTGEVRLGALRGVATTESGWYDGREVVRVRYDPKVIALKDLLARAEALDCASAVYLASKEEQKLAKAARLRVGAFGSDSYRAAKASDQKRQLPGTAFVALSLSPEQATKVNAWARTDPEKAKSFLTARQREALR